MDIGRRGLLALGLCGLIGVAGSSVTVASPAPYRVAFQSTVSGSVPGLSEDCQAHQDELYPQLITYPDRAHELTVVYSEDGIQPSANAKVSATSSDGGATWQRFPISPATSCSGGPSERAYSQNPLVAGGPDGQAFFGENWFTDNSSVADSELLGSKDYGEHWVDLSTPPGTNSQALPVVADPTRPGLIYASWLDYARPSSNPTPVGFIPLFRSRLLNATSVDGGKHWLKLGTAVRPLPDSAVLNAALLRDPDDGSLLDVYQVVRDVNVAANIAGGFGVGTTPLKLHTFVKRSTDRGAHWSRPVALGQNDYIEYPAADGSTATPYNPGPIDVAIGPHGRAAVAWANLPANGRGTIELTTTSDGGQSWTAPFTAITAPGNAFAPAIAITDNGDIGMFWYDLSDDKPGDKSTDVDAWFATSNDGGHTWSRTLLAGPFSIESSIEPNQKYDDGAVLGFYEDAAAFDTGFAVAYTVGKPLAGDGHTDVRFAKVVPTGQ